MANRSTSEPPATDTRHVSPYSLREKLARVAWWIVQATVFRWSPHGMYGWRRALLNLFGAKLAASVHIRPSVRIECPWNLSMGANSSAGDHAVLYALGPITIDSRVTVSQYVYLCAASHDYTSPDMPLQRIPIVIESDAWVAARAFVGPGVTVGEGAVLGACGCAFRDLKPWTVYGGNPAQEIKPRPPLPS